MKNRVQHGLCCTESFRVINGKAGDTIFFTTSARHCAQIPTNEASCEINRLIDGLAVDNVQLFVRQIQSC